MKEETETLLEEKERKEEDHVVVVAWLEKLEKLSRDQQPSEQLGFLKMLETLVCPVIVVVARAWDCSS